LLAIAVGANIKVSVIYCFFFAFCGSFPMRKFTMVLAIALSFCLLTAVGNAATNAKRSDKGNQAAKNETYTVIQVGSEVTAVPKSQLNEQKKQLADRYKKDLKAYETAKKEAGKDKEKVADLVKPVKHDYTMKILKSSLKSREDAQTWIEEHPLDEDSGDAKAPKTAKKTN
jgi:hypothetical protein